MLTPILNEVLQKTNPNSEISNFNSLPPHAAPSTVKPARALNEPLTRPSVTGVKVLLHIAIRSFIKPKNVQANFPTPLQKGYLKG
ncbi:hypothetical protein HYALB_00000047 [Hymenoscyphus albidus]|uniref:Uncharacterized protein n=1 Tax=Hymenoscyphus albidus TaxID=595503 RepID=A0A9N9LHN4_9HELO|nr:hypothetical protein HYALB_00000047 [Hymenoscyphus albidus]